MAKRLRHRPHTSNLQRGGAHNPRPHQCAGRPQRRRQRHSELGASSDANGNLAGYRLERSVNGGGWEQVWQGAGTSCAQNIVYGWGSVAFRVKAYDHAGWQSGYATGPTRSVHNNTAPTVPPHITVPELICGGDDITVGWGESSDADNNFAGYRLECSINGGAFSQVYQGTELSSIQSVAKEWESVAFRVKAYDSDGFESQYATTPNRTVVHNPDAPSEIAYGEPVALKEIRLSCAPAPGTDESGMSYVWERSIDAGEFLQFQVTAQPLASDVVPDNGARYQARVKAVDPQGLASGYQTGADKQIYCKGDSVYMKADVGASCFLHVCARAAADTKDKEMTLHYDSAALQLNSFDFIPVDGADFTREGVEGHNARLVSSQRGQCGLVCVKALEQNAVWDGVVAVCGFTALGTEPTQVVLL